MSRLVAIDAATCAYAMFICCFFAAFAYFRAMMIIFFRAPPKPCFFAAARAISPPMLLMMMPLRAAFALLLDIDCHAIRRCRRRPRHDAYYFS